MKNSKITNISQWKKFERLLTLIRVGFFAVVDKGGELKLLLLSKDY